MKVWFEVAKKLKKNNDKYDFCKNRKFPQLSFDEGHHDTWIGNCDHENGKRTSRFSYLHVAYL
jgi:hypothetical protein